jgi:LmbE family N-acetylglucosaminyl deacetylase
VLGFESITIGAAGLDDVRLDTIDREPATWAAHVAAVAVLLREHRPALVLVPHATDDNPTHQGVHRLVLQALAQTRLDTVIACTEFWSTQPRPNLLVQTSITDTARLLLALEQHAGEIERNPYHLRLPAFMADAVRRGGELIAGAGEAPPDFAFATVYRLTRFAAGQPVADLPPHLCPAGVPLTTPSLLP